MKRKRTGQSSRAAKVLHREAPLLSPETSDSEGDNGIVVLPQDQGGKRNQKKPATTPLTPSSPALKPPSEQKVHFCSYDGCGKSFNRPARLAEHIRSHTNERVFKCGSEGCNKDFLRQSHLNHHVKSAHENVRDYVCDMEDCDKRFLTSTRLKRHQATHEGKNRYLCSGFPPCGEVFRKHATLQRHIISAHLNQKPFPCTHADMSTPAPCTEAFDTAAQLRKHQGRAHGGLRYWCSECTSDSTATPTNNSAEQNATQLSIPSEGVGFATYALLQSHLRIAHPPSCVFCPQTCGSQGELRHHVEIHHSGSSLSDRRTHLCDFPGCDRGFTKPYNLTLHKRTVHEGEKRFICGETDLSRSKKLEGWHGQDACRRAFQTKGNLEEHIRTQHLALPGSRPRQTQAGSIMPAASTITKLTGAGYINQPLPEYFCIFSPGCAYHFTRQRDLTSHLQRRHGLADREIQYAMMEGGALSGGKFWTSCGSDDDDDDDDNEGEGMIDIEAETERLAAEGGEFWLESRTAAITKDSGASIRRRRGGAQGQEEMDWQKEMEVLVSAEEERDVTMVDPQLR